MAIIVILQDHPGATEALRNSLEEHNELRFVKDPSAAMVALERGGVDLIIARVHLDTGNVFEFIRQVKQDDRFRQLPLICFCGKRTEMAKALCPSVAHATEVLGADKYICLDQFCAEQGCDFERLRWEIEQMLPGVGQQSH